MIISDLMTKEVISVKKDTPIVEIAKTLSDKRIHAVPVVDEHQKVIGIITETDFFSKDPSNFTYLPTLIDFVKSGRIRDTEDDGAVKAVVNATANDIMTSPCITIYKDSEAQEFLKLVNQHKFNTIPVVDNYGVLVGIITVVDVLKLL
jgi:CBS-domain-containing membrane protein